MAGDRSFHVLRRQDGAVQVGGINVFPSRVAEVLARHPLVAQASVRLAAPEQGGRLKALIVCKDPMPTPPPCGRASKPGSMPSFPALNGPVR
jgi:acyl-CoA synthetase (AMP-forming)/AMP-acid ligase II